MQIHTKSLSFFVAFILSGCAGLGSSDRIGANDGSDRCFPSLKQVDEIAVYYNDSRTKYVLKGSAIGAGATALAGAAVGYALHGTSGALIGAAAGAGVGGVAGGLIASSYWAQKLEQANNNKEMAIAAMDSDLRNEITNLERVDKAIEALYNCRAQQRDHIRLEFAAGNYNRERAQIEWQKWAEQVERDKAELSYLGSAIQNMKTIGDHYREASNVIGGVSDKSSIPLPQAVYLIDGVYVPYRNPIETPESKALYLVDGAYIPRSQASTAVENTNDVDNTEEEEKIAEIKQEYDLKEVEIKRQNIKPIEKEKRISELKSKKNSQLAQFKSVPKKVAVKKPVSNKEADKYQNTKTMVSAVLEKIQLVEKKADLLSKLQQDSKNPSGFEIVSGSLSNQPPLELTQVLLHKSAVC